MYTHISHKYVNELERTIHHRKPIIASISTVFPGVHDRTHVYDGDKNWKLLGRVNLSWIPLDGGVINCCSPARTFQSRRSCDIWRLTDEPGRTALPSSGWLMNSHHLHTTEDKSFMHSIDRLFSVRSVKLNTIICPRINQ